MLLGYGPNKVFLVADSCGATERNCNRVSSDITDDTIENNTVVSNHFHSVKILLFSSARSRNFDGLIGIEIPVSMYTTKTPIDWCRFNVRSST